MRSISTRAQSLVREVGKRRAAEQRERVCQARLTLRAAPRLQSAERPCRAERFEAREIKTSRSIGSL